MENTSSALRVGSLLKGTDYTYHIEKVLGQGSFGITYLASTKISLSGKLGNIETDVKVAVKEFYMREFCGRHEDGTVTEMTGGSLVQNYSKKFRKEAENLAKLSHPNIVNILEVFDANNTCYYAMQYIAGGSLDEYVRRRGGLPESEAVECIRQIGSAVQYMHGYRMLHLDLKPSNVMRSGDGKKMVLIDFGLSKQYEENGVPESSTTIGLGTAGYAPLEQSRADRDKDFAPTLDVYALGATFFKLLTGMTPPDAAIVYDDGFPMDALVCKGVSNASIKIIEAAMEPRKSRRIPDINSFLAMLSASDIDDEKTDIGIQSQASRMNSQQRPGPAAKHQAKPQLKPESVTKLNPSPKPSSTAWLKWLLIGAAAVVLVFLVRWTSRPRSYIPYQELPEQADSIQSADSRSVEIRDRNRASSDSVMLTNAESGLIHLRSITLNKTSITLAQGQTATLTVQYDPTDAMDKTTAWESTDPKVATVSSTGRVTALRIGGTSIIVTCAGQECRCDVNVVKPASSSVPLKQISFSAGSLSLEEGQEASLTVNYIPSNATDKTTVWKSTDPEVAIVSNSGRVMAVKAGSAAIIASSGGCDAYCNVTVSVKKKPVVASENGADSRYGSDEVIEEEAIPFALVEEKPSFQGGDPNKFSQWIGEHLKYPEIARENGVSGRVIVQFTIEADGTLTNVKVLKGVDISLDKEAVRVVSSSPKWKPGKHRDRAVRVSYNFPIVFSLR